MKIIDILQGREALVRLTNVHFTNYKVLRDLVRLKKRTDEELEFYTEQERKAVDEYAEKTKSGQPVFLDNGRLKLKDVDAKVAFDNEIGKLNNTEVEDLLPVTIREVDFKSSDDFPTAAEMDLLSPFIRFEGE